MRHVPKKLTDCPENLRESIDWLIQVRHGNGKPDEGLTKLSQALKKLIEEAISNATKSLETEKKKLSCPFKYSDKETYCQYYDSRIKKCQEASKDDETKKSIFQTTIDICTKSKEACIKAHKKHPPSAALKSVEEKIVQLGQLAGQLGSFIGESDKVTDAINKAKECLQERFKKCKSCLNQLHNNSHDCQDASNCQSIKQKIEKLQSQKSSINGKQNTPNDLLNNLCTGLEKFLGFNPSSKGYDGSGIVYSDLDRLCDAVMGFLSGVLGAVKDDSNVKHYVKHIEPKLNDVICKLHDSVGKGTSEFENAVGVVSAWLGMYSGQVNERTESVTSELDKAGESLQQQLKEWKTTVSNISRNVRKIETDHINKLDYVLSNQINNEMLPISDVVEHLKNASSDSVATQALVVDGTLASEQKKLDATLEMATEQVQEMLRNQKSGIDIAINKGVQVLKGKLKDDFHALFKKVLVLNEVKSAQFGHIKISIKDAENMVNDLITKFDPDYREKISKHFENMKLQITDLDPMNTHVGAIGNMSILKRDADKVRTDLQEIEQRLKYSVTALDRWMVESGMAIYKSQKEISKILKDVKWSSENRQKVVVAATTLKTQADELHSAGSKATDGLQELVQKAQRLIVPLEDVYKTKLYEVYEGVTEAVKEVQEKITAMGKQFNKSAASSNFENMIRNIQKEIEKISKPSGIEEIKQKVWSDFAEKCSTQDKFESNVLTEWIGKILKKNELVIFRLRKYFEANKRANGKGAFTNKHNMNSANDLHDVIKLQLKIALQNDVTKQATATFTGAQGSDISNNLNAVKECCRIFAEQVEKKIQADENAGPTSGTFVKGIVEAISRSLGVDQSNSDYYDHYLKLAVHAILPALATAASQIVDDLDAFLNKCKFSNVDGALSAAVSLYKKFETALDKGSESAPRDGSAQAVDTRLRDVKTAVSDIQKDLSKNTITIVGFESKRQDPYDMLTRAIADIGSKVTDALQKIGSVNGVTGKQLETVNNSIDELCKPIETAGINVQQAMELLKGDRIGMKLKGICDQIDAVRSKNINAVTTVIDSVLIIIKRLDDVPADVDRRQKVVDGVMEELKQELEKLRGEIYLIQVAFREADHALKTSIDHVLTTLKSCQEDAESAVSALQKQLLDIVQIAFEKSHESVSQLRINLITQIKLSFKALTTDVQKLFAAERQSDLEALQMLLGKKLDKVKQIIRNNLNEGSKGFLVKTHFEFVTRIEDIKNISASAGKSSPLSSGAGILNTAFTAFFSKLRTQKDFTFDFDKISSPNDALSKLLKDLVTSQHFDDGFTKNLQKLKNRLGQFAPEKFGDGESPVVLEALRKGYPALVGELEKAYVRVYDGADIIVWSQKTNDKDHPSEDSAKCAKAFLSLLSILYSEFKALTKFCASRCKSARINKNTELGTFFTERGYIVSKPDEQDGELQDTKGFLGLHISKRLFGNDEQRIYNIDKSKQNALDTLHDCLQTYYQVSHVATFSAKKRPCNIFEMLCWVSGLPCNNVYDDLLDVALSDLFVDPKKETTLEDITVLDVTSEPLAAYPQPIAYDDTRRAVKRLCSRSHDILTTIAGTGDAHSTYAVDYSTNLLNFHYPSKGEDCLQMLLDILRRLQPSLKFLHTQCGLSAAYHGWSGCQYGREVKHSNWQCREHPANESTDCQPRSPLMSYLRDCLPGCLPHQLVSAGCKSDCKTCPKSLPGAPCITPLGFRGFSGSTKTGKDICNVLTKFFDNSNINTLFGLLPKPPSTLPEHFQFALTLSNMLHKGTGAGDEVSLAFETTTKALSIDLYKETTKLTGALQNAYRNQAGHSTPDHSKSTEADLSSLSRESCDLPNERDIHCAPYLCSTSSDAYTYLAKKHASLYLSWAVYLPWTFYSYLQALLDAFQQIDCGGSGCTKCSCKPGKHGVEYNCKCNALISCRGVMTTFYQYGFTFGNAKTLYGTNRKFCLSFSTQLSNLLKSQYFKDLFTECDNFIWTIRAPFIWLNVALWSLSLFYLLCVMVGRLDVLHIKSHLRSPASHRIAAQSLLAAAQVGRLAKITYLQP